VTQVFLKFIRQFVAIFGVSAVMLVGAIVSFIAACGGGKAPALALLFPFDYFFEESL
jgi:hypothetical protein